MTETGRILIADDEEAIRQACERILRGLGYEVTAVVDGEAALRQMRSATFDLAVLDIKMPALSGIQVMECLALEKSMVPVVVITGHGTQETLSEASNAGARELLSKPFSPSQLRDAVNRVLHGCDGASGPEES